MPKLKKSRSERKEERLRKQEALDGTIKKRPKPHWYKAKEKEKPLSTKKPSQIAALFTFLKEARNELSLVTWPTRKETLQATGVLLVFVAVSAIYLGVVDSILSRLLRLVID
ncbi:MAG: preprotein translocase subunit SecE [Deltaproteobacteria bacterium]|jgi:preprotein translocase subunit SecE|nr:preprotein translocase subunit SecE [Deltaproteobacteria bacterium]